MKSNCSFSSVAASVAMIRFVLNNIVPDCTVSPEADDRIP